ncbi:transport and Golgi organization protein 1 homolog [Herpailurus yagouaroundi]|uniref:transport and Golgi organization protein 1 homolog n=1 Tax=Herpailurus yagouaroundi TaxID=1608482 RepID=UPI001AD6FB89|nr:transport and Golgi organization protein 1 homolog [Puma yagouaroundi]
MATAKNLDMTKCELVAMKNQTATAEENLKIATRDIHKCKQQMEQTREQLQKAERTFTHQVAVYDRNARKNWIRTQIWERKMAEQSREVAHLKYRLDVMQGKRLLDRHRRRRPMPGSPEKQNPARRGKRHVVMCSSLISAAKPFPVGDHRVSWTEPQTLRTAGGLKG